MKDPIRVLYIDDDPDLRTIVALALQRDPQMEVRTCATGREGLAVAEEWQPSLVLLDMMMPELDGVATRRLLRANPATADIPVAFITAVARGAERKLMEEAGAVGIIEKPFAVLELAQIVRELLARSTSDRSA